MTKFKKFRRILAGVLCCAMAFSCMSVAAFAMDDMTEPNSGLVEDNHESATMNPVKDVTPIGGSAFYKIDNGIVIYADRDDGTGWTAVPSAYILGSAYNEGNIAYGMYVVNTNEVRFVALSDCRDMGDGSFTFIHGTKDSATVSEEVDTATNDDPTMSTQFFVNIENGIDPDGPHTEETVVPGTDDPRVEYEVTVSTKTAYQLKATVPMYVCMYGFRGDGSIVTPTKDAYQLKNYSTINEGSKATIVDITKLTHYARIYDENHSDEELTAIAFNTNDGSYRYWYGKNPDTSGLGAEWVVNMAVADEHLNASGEVYAIYIDGVWSFKAAGVLDGDCLRQTVDKIDPAHPLSESLVYKDEYDFGTAFSVGDFVEGGEDKGLALKVTGLQAQPATWRLVPLSTTSMKRGELMMSLAPESAISNASAIDLSACSAETDITERGWFMSAPEVDENGIVQPDKATLLPMTTFAQMAGGNVNDAGCSPVVKVTYTVTPMFDIDDGQTETVGTVKSYAQISLQTLAERSQPAIEASSIAASKCFMFMYFLLPHWVPATWRSLAQTSIRAELPSGKVPTTRVRRRISRFSRSITLLVRMRVQCS